MHDNEKAKVVGLNEAAMLSDERVSVFLQDLEQLCQKHGVGIIGDAALYGVGTETALRYVCDSAHNLTLFSSGKQLAKETPSRGEPGDS